MSPIPEAPLTMHTSGVGTPQTSARGRVLRSTKDNKYSPSKFVSPVKKLFLKKDIREMSFFDVPAREMKMVGNVPKWFQMVYEDV